VSVVVSTHAFDRALCVRGFFFFLFVRLDLAACERLTEDFFEIEIEKDLRAQFTEEIN
jgi:hypothetical protein